MYVKKISIGRRNIKTAISVFIAINVYLVLLLIDKKLGNSTDGFSGYSGMYTPFFAGIAAAYTSHKDYKSSLKQAKIRSVGSVIGGFFGMIVILLVEFLFIKMMPVNEFVLYKFLEYLFVSIGIVFLIYLNVKTKQTEATFISCLTYLSVTISIRNGGMPIAQFAVNRILSTLIGVAIALLVNNIRIFFKKNHNVLFIANIDNDINYSSYPLSYTRYKINDIYQRDAKLVLHSQASSVDQKLFKDIHINKQLILMNGVCIYDDMKKDYIYSCDFTENSRRKLNEFFKGKENVFTYIIHDLRLAVHYENLTNEVTIKYYKNEKDKNTYPFVRTPVLEYHDVAKYELVIKTSDYGFLCNEIKELGISKDISIRNIRLEDEYCLVLIKPAKASRVEAIKNLPYYDSCDFKVSFISDYSDLQFLDLADFKICFDSADTNIKEVCDYVIISNDFNDVLKVFTRIYHAININKFFKKLKEKQNKRECKRD
jgi:hydroxymethylpyrimidine pyrophosphatase-like HAD family hydrolase